METLVLASQSPRRIELLRLAGIPFETVKPDVDESCACSAPDAVSILSARKALEVCRHYPGRFILAADTLVAINGSVLGKPASEKDAAAMLRALSGCTHQVYTGVSVISPSGTILTESDHSDVTFCEIPDEEIYAYVKSGEPLDKAGAYAIQGRASLWVSHLDGNYTSVMGLPLYLIRTMLLRAGYQFSSNI